MTVRELIEKLNKEDFLDLEIEFANYDDWYSSKIDRIDHLVDGDDREIIRVVREKVVKK